MKSEGAFPRVGRQEGRIAMSRRKASAFTLIELMMVIAIMAIMLGAVTPSFHNVMAGRALKTSSQALANMIRYARSTAVAQSVMSKIVFDGENKKILLYVEADPFNTPGILSPTPFPVRFTDELGKSVSVGKIMKNNLSGSQEENEVTCNPDGSTSDTLIYLTDTANRIYTVGIVGLTGQVQVWERRVENLYEG